MVTIATPTDTAGWDHATFTWVIPMLMASGSTTVNAPVIPSNATAVNIGPMVVVWNQATNALSLKLTSLKVGLVKAKVTFTDLANTVHTCTASFGSAARVTGAMLASWPIVRTQAQTGSFCSGADLTAFKALVAAKKTAKAAIPVAIAYQFEQHNPVDGTLVPGQVLNTVIDKPWSSTVNVKLNWRATAN